MHALDYLPDASTLLPERERDPLKDQEVFHGRIIEPVDNGLTLPHCPTERRQHGHGVAWIKFGHAPTGPLVPGQGNDVGTVQSDEEVGSTSSSS